MKIKLSKGKPKTDGLYLIITGKDTIDLVSIEDGWVFNLDYSSSTILEKYDIKGWKKLVIDSTDVYYD